MSRPRAWILNLDAEAEFERGEGYQPRRDLSRIVQNQSARWLHELAGPRDRVLLPDEVARNPGLAQGFEGRAWSPTPTALETLRLAGAECPAGPDFEVLRRVNARPFTANLRSKLELSDETLPKTVIGDLESALRHLDRPLPEGWLVRRSFGAAGRGRRRLYSGQQSEPDLHWLRAGLRAGPLVMEPFVRITREYTRSGFLAADGSLTLASPCLQATTAQGAWTRSELEDKHDRDRADDARLSAAMEQVGRALHAAGYFGPYGIDAFRHERLDGSGEVLNVLSEINARYTMDWALSMEGRRELASKRG